MICPATQAPARPPFGLGGVHLVVGQAVVLDSPDSDLSAGLKAQSAQNTHDVMGRRAFRDGQVVGDPLVGVATGDQSGDFSLARRE